MVTVPVFFHLQFAALFLAVLGIASYLILNMLLVSGYKRSLVSVQGRKYV